MGTRNGSDVPSKRWLQADSQARCKCACVGLFPTPAWATYALIDHEALIADIWEPACRDGSTARVLERRGNRIISSDLYDRDLGQIGHRFSHDGSCVRPCPVRLSLADPNQRAPDRCTY